MADPLSILGAAVGVTSLIMQMADECIKGFKFYIEARNMPETYSFLRVRLQMEQQRFLNFGLEAGILYADGTLCDTLHVHRPLLLAILAEIKTLLENYISANGKYEKLMEDKNTHSNDNKLEIMDLLCLPGPDSNQTKGGQATSQKPNHLDRVRNLGKTIAQSGRNLRTIIVEPKRLAWAAVDKDTFEQLISRLEDLNSFLIALLDKSQLQRLQDTINTSYLELLQIRNDVGSLTDLVKALTPPVREKPAGWHPESWNYIPSRAAAEETAAETKKREYLKQLVDIKIQFAKMDQLSSNGTAGMSIREFPNTPPLSLDEFRFHDGLLDPDDLPRRSNALYRGSSIWVEWKRISATENSRPAVDGVRVRISLLTDLLSRAIPTGFRAPPCLGYVENVDSNDETRFGIVFNNLSMNGSPCELISLYELLAREQKPSLTKRMALCAALARSVYAFHSVNWLHKGLRSDNIIFFASSPNCVDLTAPYVSGFELSRPSIVEGMTEKPKFDPLQDIYRHPYAQSTQTDGNYRKSYDIYSLGMILIEISLWAPIEQIVGIADLSRSKPSVLQDLRQSLLGRTSFMLEHSLPSIPGAWACLQQVDTACGELFRNVVRCCLTADEIERREYPEEPESAAALRLQRVTEREIVKGLEGTAQAL